MIDYGFWMKECFDKANMDGFWYWFNRMVDDTKQTYWNSKESQGNL